ncbi:uncharacterized protein ISCGN_000829 [Ixodes scapularis]
MAQHPKLQLEPPINISKVKLSQATEAFLSQGPKFAPELPVSRVENLAAVHEVASKIPEANRQDFVSAGSRTVRFHGGGSTTGNMARTVIEEFRQADLRLLEADKEGIFVVLDRDQLDQKTSAALCKNFRPLRARPSGSLRSEAKALCDSLNLPSLKSLISLPSQQYLSIFFSAKTHKPDIPLRSIISEKGCWQRPLALFLQKQLSVLDLPHPFRIDNSSALIKPLEELHSAQNTVAVFSLDIVDMYYSLDIPTMLCFISEAIHLHGAVRFQNSAGISVSGFLDLNDLYLRSTLVEHEGRIYAQKTGVCIGSCLAPILSEIYLFFVDRRSCSKKHATKFVPCRQASVYSIPLGCGAQYIGQTGRCLNDRLREHANEVQQAASNPSLHSLHPIAQHVGSCLSCEPEFSATTTVGTHRSRYGREIIEAFAMRHSPQNIGSPSLCLSDADVSFLRPELRQT